VKELLSLNKFLWKYRWELLAGFVMIILSNFVSVLSINYVGSAINDIESLLVQFQSGDVNDLSAVKTGLMKAALLFIGLK